MGLKKDPVCFTQTGLGIYLEHTTITSPEREKDDGDDVKYF